MKNLFFLAFISLTVLAACSKDKSADLIEPQVGIEKTDMIIPEDDVVSEEEAPRRGEIGCLVINKDGTTASGIKCTRSRGRGCSVASYSCVAI